MTDNTNDNFDPIKYSLLNHAPSIMLAQFSGNPLMDEMFLWKGFKDQNLLEPNDKKEINHFMKKSFKLLIVTVAAGGVLNRGLSKIKIGSFEFFKLHFLLRFPIRLTVFGLSFYFIGFNPLMNNLMKLHYYLNMKYCERYKQYNINCDPKTMNPLFLDDPSLSTEEKEIRRFEYDKIRSKQSMLMMQNREYEQMMKSGKKF